MKITAMKKNNADSRSLSKLLGRACAAGLLLVSGLAAHASNSTWTGTGATGNWTDATWSAGVPGGSGTTTSTDVATFNTTVSGGSTITVDSNRNISGITYNNAGAFTLTGGPLLLTSGGEIQITTATAAGSETINTPITLEGNYTFSGYYNNTSYADVLNFGGNITGPATTGTTVLTLGSTNVSGGTTTAVNTISGIIADGNTGAGDLVGITKTGVGYWLLSGNNTYTGATTVKGGMLELTGSGASAITVGSGQNGTVNGNAALYVAPTVSGTTTVSTSLTYNGAQPYIYVSAAQSYSDFALANTTAGNVVVNYGSLNLTNGLFDGDITTASGTNAEALFSSVNRAAGTTMNFYQGTYPGLSAIGTANAVNVVFTTAPTLVGGGGTAGSNTISIVPWANIDGNLTTYDSTHGLRQITAGTEQTALVSGMTGSKNASMSASTSLSATTSVNSLEVTSSGNTLTLNGNTLNITSGALDLNKSVTVGASVGDGTINFGSAEGIIYVGISQSANLNSALSGTNGATFSFSFGAGATAGSLALNNANPNLSGVVTPIGQRQSQSLLYLNNTNALAGATLNFNNGGIGLFFGPITAGSSAPTSYTLGGLEGNIGINLNNNNTSAQAIALTVGGDNDTSDVYSGILSNTVAGASLIKTGTGSLTLSGANTYTGGTTINNGTLVAGSTAAFGTTAGTLAINGGTVDLAPATGTINAYNTTVGGNATITSDAATAGSAGNTYTLGTLSIGANTLTVATGSNVSSGFAQVTFGATTLTGASTFKVTGASTLNLGAVTNGGNSATVTGSGFFSQTGTWSGAGGLTFDTNFSGQAALNFAGTFAGNLALNSNSGIVTLYNYGTANTLSGQISGSGNLTVNNNAGTPNTTTYLTGANNGWTGNLIITSGEARAGSLSVSTNPFTSSNVVSIASGADFNLGFASTTIAGLNDISGGGSVICSTTSTSAISLTLGGSGNYSSSDSINLTPPTGSVSRNLIWSGSGSQVLSGNLSGLTSGVNVTNGSLTLSGSNTYSGTTTVSGGNLMVNNTSGSGTGTGAVQVNGGALGGTGTINTSGVSTGKAVDIASGGLLSPSNTTTGFSHLTLALQTGTTATLEAPSLSTTPQLVFNLGSSTATSDEVIVTGGQLALNGQQWGNFTFNALSGITSGTYVLIDSSNAGLTGTLGATVNGTLDAGLYQGTLSLSGGDLDLMVAAVPEPSTWAMMIGGLALLAMLQRRKSAGLQK